MILFQKSLVQNGPNKFLKSYLNLVTPFFTKVPNPFSFTTSSKIDLTNVDENANEKYEMDIGYDPQFKSPDKIEDFIKASKSIDSSSLSYPTQFLANDLSNKRQDVDLVFDMSYDPELGYPLRED